MKFEQKNKKNKKGFQAVQGIILTLVIITVTLAVGLMIIGKFKEKLTPNSEEANATAELLKEISGITTYIGILIVVAIFGIILSYLLGWFGGGGRRRSR